MSDSAADSTHYWGNAAVDVHKVVVGPIDNNVFVVRCRQTGDAALIDAANEHDMLLDLCKKLGVTQVLETHGHWDHIQAVPHMREAGYEVAVTAEDADEVVRMSLERAAVHVAASLTLTEFIDDREAVGIHPLGSSQEGSES